MSTASARHTKTAEVSGIGAGVARTAGGREVAGSNPVSPTTLESTAALLQLFTIKWRTVELEPFIGLPLPFHESSLEMG